MIALKTVLCPVDFSPATPRQVDLASDLCRAFGARLMLHHNRQSMGIGPSVGWMWNADHQGNPQAAAEEKLRDCVSRVPEGVSVQPLLTEGPTSRMVLVVAEAVDADLVLLTTHGTMSDEHASITEQLLAQGERATLVLHEPSVEPRTPQFASRSKEVQVVVAPTDLTSASRSAMDVGFDLARTLPIELHLLHFLPKARRHGRDDAVEEKIRSEMRALVPPDVADRAQVHIEHGNPAEGIPRAAQQLSAACIVMGEHTRNPVWRLFGRDTSRAVLHQARCPVWYVPATRASSARGQRQRA
jgi:nucleotide-binding universal stress UspA family protein